MSPTPSDVDVLIVGAGPVGLLLANECARRGLRYRIVESQQTQSEHSKALAIFPRTLEILDMAGLVDPFLEAANRVTSVAILTHERALAHMRFMPEQSPYAFIAMVPQDQTERILARQLGARGGVIEYGTSFVSATQRREAVDVVLENGGRRLSLAAAFVVGCDGAHSTMRHLLDLPFAGASYDDTFLLADIETNQALPASELQLCPSIFGPVAIFPMSATRRRVVATIERAQEQAPSLELVQGILRQRGPQEIEARALHWSSYFRIHHRQVAQLRIGRLFVAGDAAHIHSPFGGQGMNTGLHDVWNLAWKLDLVLRGHGADRLLETYTAERRPVIQSTIEMTDFLTKAMGTPHVFAQAIRDTVIPMVSKLAPFQHAFVQRLSELGIDYHGSPIVEGQGARFFNDTLRGGGGIRSRFLLVYGAEKVEEAKRFADSWSEIVELRRADGDEVVLVRPDGYVAYAGDDLLVVRELLERQTSGRLSGVSRGN